MFGSRLAGLLALALGLLVGCGLPGQATRPAPATSADSSAAVVQASFAPGVPDGWDLYEEADDGFAIALPPEYDRIDTDEATLTAFLDTLKQQNPDEAETLDREFRGFLDSGAPKLWAFDQTTENTGSNVLVIKEPLSRALTLDQYVQVTLRQLDNVAEVIRPIQQQRVTLAAGEAVELRYDQRGDTAGDASDTTVQYLVVDGRTAFVLTFIVAQERADTFVPIFQQAAQTFRLLN